MRKWVKKTGGIILSAAMIIGAAGVMPEGTLNGFCVTAEAAASYTVNNGVLISATGVSGDVVIPANLGITAIKTGLFSGNTSITSLVLPEGFEIIAGSAFSGCSNMKSVTFPSTLKSIGKSAFSGCKSLTDLDLPEGMTELAESSFEGCSGIKTVTIPSTVEAIGKKAFYQCTGITGATIQEGTTKIGNSSFQRCTNLKTLKIPASVTLIGSSALSQTGLTDIFYDGSENRWNSITIESNNLSGVAIHYSQNQEPTVDYISAIPEQTYTGSALTPEVTVMSGNTVLVSGKDYTVSYSNNINVGTATVTVTGKGSYIGTITGTFVIAARRIENCTVSDAVFDTYTSATGAAAASGCIYSGNENRAYSHMLSDGNTVLREGTDYTVSYSNNINVGTAVMTFTGKGNYKGTLNYYFVITPLSVSALTISEIADQTFTGSAITPAPTVKHGSKVLVSGTDYTTAYSNNVNVGTATVKITGKGNYTDTATVRFTIKAAAVRSPKVTAVPGDGKATLTWNAIDGAERYAAYIVESDGTLKALATRLTDTSYTASKLTNGTTYKFLVRAYVNGKWTDYDNNDIGTCTLPAPAAKPVVTATPGDAQVILRWNAIDSAERYAVYCIDPTGTTAAAKCLTSKLTATTLTVSKLTNGVTYKFYVRAYVNGKWTAFDESDYVNATPVSSVVKPTVEVIPADKQVTLTWDAIDGAEKYAVYMVQDDGTLKALATRLTDTEYTIKKLTNHTAYKFLVRAYVNGKWTKYDESDYVNATPAALKPLVRTSAYDGMVTLRWGEVDNATKYAAYIVNNDGSLTCVSSKITNIKYTIKKLTNGTAYRFLVRAYVNGSWTKYTERDIVSATPKA